MLSYDHPNASVIREQAAVEGRFLFFQKAKLKALHVFKEASDNAKRADAELTLTLNDQKIGKVVLTEQFGRFAHSCTLLDILLPQGSILEVAGDTGYGLVAEYHVAPDADQTTTNADRR